MNYEVLHLERGMHAIKEGLWHRLIEIIENENTFEEIVEKFSIVVEKYNDLEKSSFRNVVETFDFVISTFVGETQIRVADGVDGDDFIVVNII